MTREEVREHLKEIEILGQIGKYRQDLVTEAMELSTEMFEEMNRQAADKPAERRQDADPAPSLLMPSS